MVMDTASIGAAVTSLNAVKGMVELAFNAKLDSERRSAKAEALAALGTAQDTLYELREELFRLQDENRQLKQAATTQGEWAAKEAEFERFHGPGGAWVYQSKLQPGLFACPTCIGEKKLNLLQPRGQYTGVMNCMACKAGFQVNVDKPVPSALPRGNGGKNGWMRI